MKFLFSAIVLGFVYFGCERPTETGSGDDGIPPAVPEGLRVYLASDAEIIIEWMFSREIDIRQYKIYRSTDSLNFSLLDSTDRDFYFDDSLEYQTRYYYRITAEDFYGNESGFTEAVSAVPENLFPPHTPRRVEINARNWNGRKSVYLSWSVNEESDISGYKIYRSDAPGFSPDSNSLAAIVYSNEYDDLSANEFYHYYYYRLRAVDKGNLQSSATTEIADRILEEPVLISPADNSVLTDFRRLTFLSTGVPADYKIIIQTNQFFGEVWQKDISSDAAYDTIKVDAPAGILYYNTNYYWRVAAYSSGNEPNSVSPLNKFLIKP